MMIQPPFSTMAFFWAWIIFILAFWRCVQRCCAASVGDLRGMREKWRCVTELRMDRYFLTFPKIIEWLVGMNECLSQASWTLAVMPDPLSYWQSESLCTLATCGCPRPYFILLIISDNQRNCLVYYFQISRGRGMLGPGSSGVYSPSPWSGGCGLT